MHSVTAMRGFYLYTRTDDKLFNIAQLHAKTKVRHTVSSSRNFCLTTKQPILVCISTVTHLQLEICWPVCPRLQRVLANHQPKEDKAYGSRFRYAPSLHHRWATPGGLLVVVLALTPILDLRFPVLSVNLDSKLNNTIGKAVGTWPLKLNSRVWNNRKLTEKPKYMYRFARLAFSVPSSTTVRQGPPTESRKKDSTVSTYGVLDVYCTSTGRTG